MMDSRLIELITVVENEFDISIEDEEVITTIATPRELARYIYQQLQKGSHENLSESNATQRKFQYLRRELSKNFHIALPKILIDTPITKILKQGQIKKKWRILNTLCNSKRGLPMLGFPHWVYALFAISDFLIAVIMHLVGYKPLYIISCIFAFNIIAFIPAYICLKTRIPKKITNVASLLPYIEDNEQHNWSEQYILFKVMDLTSEVFYIPLEEIQPDGDFSTKLVPNKKST